MYFVSYLSQLSTIYATFKNASMHCLRGKNIFLFASQDRTGWLNALKQQLVAQPTSDLGAVSSNPGVWEILNISSLFGIPTF